MLEEIIGETLVRTILNVIGGTIRWIIGNILNRLLKRKHYKYKEYLFDKDNSSDSGCLNIIVAILFISVIVLIISNIY